jgi:hypothetical protein
MRLFFPQLFYNRLYTIIKLTKRRTMDESGLLFAMKFLMVLTIREPVIMQMELSRLAD